MKITRQVNILGPVAFGNYKIKTTLAKIQNSAFQLTAHFSDNKAPSSLDRVIVAPEKSTPVALSSVQSTLIAT